MNTDEINDLSIRIVDRLVLDGLIKNCMDTDLEDEFLAQDIIREELKFTIDQNINKYESK